MAGLDKSSTGLEASVAAGLAVLLGWVGGLVFYLVEKDSKFVKFYGLQSILISLGFNAIPLVGFALKFSGPFGWGLRGVGGLLWLLLAICWVIMLINAFQGKVWEAPIAGPYCRRQTGL